MLGGACSAQPRHRARAAARRAGAGRRERRALDHRGRQGVSPQGFLHDPHLLFPDRRFRTQHRAAAPLQGRIPRPRRRRVRPFEFAGKFCALRQGRVDQARTGAGLTIMASISIRNLVKRYGNFAVIPDLNLEISDHEFVVFVGPSGCGKSTLLRIIAGLEPITAGEVYIGDKRVNGIPAAQRDIAMVFQDYALYPHMRVYDNMSFALELRGTPKAEIDARVKRAAALLHIEPYLDRKPKELSGGQRQRVAMGRAIVRNPKAFLVDQPLSNPDAELRVQMRTEVSRIQSQLGTTTGCVTHEQTAAMTLGVGVAVVRSGA